MWRHVWGRCLQTITVRAQGAGRSSEWVGFGCSVSAGVDKGLLWNFSPRDLAKETHHAMYDILFLPISPSGLGSVLKLRFFQKTHRIYAPRRKGEYLSKLHLIVSLVWNGKVVLRGSCFLTENYDCCRLGGFRGPSVWLLKCSTHDIMTVLPYGTADHILKSRN